MKIIERFVNLLQIVFCLFILAWAIHETGSNPVFVFGLLYTLYRVWGHGFATCERKGIFNKIMTNKNENQ